MIISHRYRCIFVKTRKTAGTSIEVFLAGLCGDDDVITPIQPPVEGHRPRHHRGWWNPLREASPRGLADLARRRKFWNHMPAAMVRARISAATWRDYFKFCVERNPWDKVVSHYQSRTSRGRIEMSFDRYLDSPEVCVDWPMYTDRSGGPIVDRVLRYEQLDQELSTVCGELGIPWTGRLGVRAKGAYRQDARPYREWYDERQRRRVSELFAREISLLGYQF